ncbi:MAG TPA: intein-containing Rv2578c family radical SAM protein [Actinocatenispora sp.]
MRWEELRADRAAEGMLPLDLPDPGVPERGSGRAGLRLAPTGPVIAGTDDAVAIEIHAKSLINRVPASSDMPFQWTINPYRGCTHACTYCLAGDTRILMADGTTRALSELRVGDEIYGTRADGPHRRYATNRVLAHWSTVKRAYRVALADGTELVASGEHRFLTRRGWKHVTGTSTGADRRPHLTLSSHLLGTGMPAPAPKDCDDYRIGYLSGMVRAAGHLGTQAYHHGTVHRFRLTLADDEALLRVRDHLAGFGITTTLFDVPATATREIRTSSEADVAAIIALIAWPSGAADDWHRGFLAGLFDAGPSDAGPSDTGPSETGPSDAGPSHAEGSHDRGVLRIAGTDPDILDRAAESLRRFGFEPAYERRADGLRHLRLRGGLAERLRFFHLTDPAITSRRSIVGATLTSDADLRVTAVDDLGIDVPMYDITTETGDFIANGVVSHNCFARNTHTYLDLDAGHDFDSKIVVKVNAGAVLRRELASPRWRGEPIAMGTNVDCYQRVEGRYRLMREILSALRDHANPYSVLTKGTLIQRDMDLILQAAEITDVSVAFSIGFVDEELWRHVEPGTPSPTRRLDLVRRFADAGLGASVLMAPILPGLTDGAEQIDRTVAALVAAGARSITPIVLHLRPGAREWYLAFLRREHPRLLEPYRRLYRDGSYAPAAYQREVTARVRTAARRHGLRDRDDSFRRVGGDTPDGSGGDTDSPDPRHAATSGQLRLL